MKPWLGILVWMAAAVPVCADETIVAHVDVTGLPSDESAGPADTGAVPTDLAFPETVTTYYKDTNSRTEILGGKVTLYRGSDGLIDTLDPATKTYWQRSMKDNRKFLVKLPRLMAQRLNLSWRTEFDRSTDPTIETQKTYVGRSAQRYSVFGWYELDRVETEPPPGAQSPNNGGGPAGGPPGGGPGFPGAASRSQLNDDSAGDPPPTLPITNVTGDVWLSPSLTLPSASSDLALASVVPGAPYLGPIVRDLADQIGRTRQIPLYCHFRVIRDDPNGATETAFTIEYRVDSVSEDPLSDALFQPPADYKKVAPPVDTGNFDPGISSVVPPDHSHDGDHKN